MKRSRPHTSHERWLVSYADFITLLFAFFVVLYASAEIDRHRMNQLSLAISSGFQQMGIFTTAPTSARTAIANQAVVSPAVNLPVSDLRELARENEELERDRLRSRLESGLQDRQIPSKYVSVHDGTDGIVVSLREVGFFDSGSAHMRSQAAPLFSKVVDLIAAQNCRLRVEGHTDNIPIHNTTFNSNWELSTARATEVIRLLITQYQFDPADLSAAGFAEFHPVATNDTSEGRSANRRIDIVVLTRAQNIVPIASH